MLSVLHMKTCVIRGPDALATRVPHAVGRPWKVNEQMAFFENMREALSKAGHVPPPRLFSGDNWPGKVDEGGIA
jgi:hypothetical protein